MKFYTTVALFASLAAAAPVEISLGENFSIEEAAPFEIVADGSGSAKIVPVDLDARHVDLDARQSTSSNQLEQGSSANCPEGILIFARGSTEPGNLGNSLGPLLSASLRSQVSSLWVQGVGGAYTAGLLENILPRGTSAAAIAEGVRLFNLARSKCPNSDIVAGGYSQGAALIAAAISDLSSTVRNQVTGAVLFGYTKNQQNGGRIPNYPADRTRIYCAEGDRVCEGTLIIADPHFSYDDEAEGVAADFLASTI